MSFFEKMKIPALACALILSGACSSNDVEYKYPEKVKGRYEMPGKYADQEKQDKLFGKDGFDLFSNKKKNENGIGVNTYLWQATLSTLSFMPLASADPFGGVVITDWYSPAATPDERFKINVLILTGTLRADGLKVSVFKQVKNNAGEWIDTKSDPAVALKMENAILTKARQIRLTAAEQ